MLVALVNTILDVFRCPTAGVFKQSDAANRAIAAQVKPMLGPARNVDQITTLHVNGKDGATIRMNMKNTLTANGESDFILAVRVLLIELDRKSVV